MSSATGHFFRVREDVVARARRIGEQVAAKHADDVDRNARFPVEAAAALREERLLGIAVPEELGGMDAGLAEIAAICSTLGQYCATTAMAYAMHQIQVLCVVRHAKDSAFLRRYLADIADEQRLIASATTELGIGGVVRASRCAVETHGHRMQLTKQASVISYGEAAHDILVTARRSPDAPESDQVLVLVKKGEYTLERTGSWDALGMRGTCSYGYLLKAEASVDHILPDSFGDISARTMHPVSHVLWTHVWLGIATSAVSIARKCVRAQARKTPDVMPPNAMRVAELVTQLHAMRGAIRDAMYQYGERYDDPDALESLSFQVRMNDLKIAAAEQVAPVVTKALSIVGIAGYRNDTPYSLGRHMRDSLGAVVQILNDRLYGTNARLLLVSKED